MGRGRNTNSSRANTSPELSTTSISESDGACLGDKHTNVVESFWKAATDFVPSNLQKRLLPP